MTRILDESTAATTPVSPPDSDKPARSRDRHLYGLDLVRLVTFGAVILDHTLMGIAPVANVAAGCVEVLLRYSRYSFFALTGFVLGYQYRNRSLEPLTFWRRRFKLIGIPYVTWSIFYWLYSRYRAGGRPDLANTVDSLGHIELTVKSLVYDLLTGNAWGHLYFLFVSMQVYVIFPALLAVLKRTWGYHRYLLAASGAFHIALLYLMVRPVPHFLSHGLLGVVWSHLVVTIFPYQFFILSGCIAALHFEAFQAFAVRWRGAVFAVSAVIIAATLGYFVNLMTSGEDPFRATNVFMVHNIFAYIAIIAILYCLGTIWQERRNPGSIADRLLKTAADRSFGIYLVHGVTLAELMRIVDRNRDLPWAPTVVITYVATVAITVFIVEVLRRSPFSLMTTGRSAIEADGQSVTKTAALGVAAIVAGVAIRLCLTATSGDLLVAGGLLLLGCAAWTWHRQNASRAQACVA